MIDALRFALFAEDIEEELQRLPLADTAATIGRAMVLPMAPNLLPYRALLQMLIDVNC